MATKRDQHTLINAPVRVTMLIRFGATEILSVFHSGSSTFSSCSRSSSTRGAEEPPPPPAVVRHKSEGRDFREGLGMGLPVPDAGVPRLVAYLSVSDVQSLTLVSTLVI